MKENLNNNVERENEGISFKEILFIIKKHIFVILGILVVFTGLGFGYSKIQKPTYVSNGSIMVAYSDTNTAISTQYTFSNYIADTYVAVLSEDKVVNKVSEEVGVPAATLKANLSSSTDALLITISYKCADQAKAKEVVQTYMDVIKEISNEIDPATNKPVYPMLNGNLSNFSDASDAKPVSKTTKNTLIFFAAGAVVAFLYVFLKELFDNRLKSKEEIEKILDVPVLSAIPFYDIDEKK